MDEKVTIKRIADYVKNLEKGLVERDAMTIKRLLGILVRVALSVLFAGIFYTGWMAIAIPTFKSGFGGLIVKATLWVLAPIVTGFGFAVGPKIFEFLPTTKKGQFWKTYKWCLAGCAIGGGIFWLFGPMLILGRC
ncbi:MAG: hypothetical protein ACYS80_25245 [Planctomycetota bacterium]|jgi:hypothetical protein